MLGLAEELVTSSGAAPVVEKKRRDAVKVERDASERWVCDVERHVYSACLPASLRLLRPFPRPLTFILVPIPIALPLPLPLVRVQPPPPSCVRSSVAICHDHFGRSYPSPSAPRQPLGTTVVVVLVLVGSYISLRQSTT